MKLKQIYKKILSENLKTFIEEDYPTSWNVEEFAKLDNFSSRKDYCDTHLTRLSSGSGRIVYKIDNDKVLKLAKNTKGVAQNEVEIELGGNSYFNNLFAKVYESDPTGKWVEMQLASKLTTGKFKSMLGFSFDDFSRALINFDAQNVTFKRLSRPLEVKDEELIYEDEFYAGVTELMSNYRIAAGDFTKTSSYGVVSDGGSDEIVLVDFGLTQDVFDDHYAK